MAKTKINCLNCNNEIYIENKEIKRGFGKFCNKKCSGEHKSKNKIMLDNNVSCALCSKQFHMSESKQKLSKSGLYFCCREHKDLSQKIGGIKEIMPQHYGTGNISDSQVYRRFVFSTKQKICERCGYKENEAAIIIHHKDRNRYNGNITNLEVLCCNCHAIEHYSKETYGDPQES